MQMRRRFEPMVHGLPYRIAPSSIAGVAPAIVSTLSSLVQALPGAAVPLASNPAVMTADSDMPQTGTATPILVAPPLSTSNGTSIC
jgi:hypothetical protein